MLVGDCVSLGEKIAKLRKKKGYFQEEFNYITNEWEKLDVKCDNCAFNLPAYDVTPNHPLFLIQIFLLVMKINIPL